LRRARKLGSQDAPAARHAAPLARHAAPLARVQEHCGEISHLLGSIVGSTDADIPRYVKFFKAALKSGQVARS
jgi:hypothetical protein